MDNRQKSTIKSLVTNLNEKVGNLFKYHGEIAKQLFLTDGFNIEGRVDISAERKYLGEILKYIPDSLKIELVDEHCTTTNFHEADFSTIQHANIFEEDNLIMTIIVYDVEDEMWMFRWNHNIRLPEKHIYFHSIKWDVDYIKPEIVLMYELLEPTNYHQIPNYRSVLDALSYYQFMTLRTIVGDDRINQAVRFEKRVI